MDEETRNQKPKRASKSPSPAPTSPADSGERGKAWVMKILTGLASAFGLGQGKTEKHRLETGDVGTNLAHQRTDLAMERNRLAAERTLMGWIRTALSMISFGFTIGKLGEVLHDVEVKGIFRPNHMISVERIAYFLVSLGTIALFAASLQHWRRMRELYAMGLRRQLSIPFIVALLLTAVGGFAFTALLLAL
jgi:putative membrane protein